LGLHRFRVARTGTGWFLDQLNRNFGESESYRDGDPVVSVESAEVVVERQLQWDEDSAPPDVFRERVQMARRVDYMGGRADELAIHRAVSGDQLRRKPNYDRMTNLSWHVPNRYTGRGVVG
jgi:hypothetical protein